MGYGFVLLSLSIVFLLVMMYYSNDRNFLRGNKIYRAILLVGYIIQLISCFIFMIPEGNANLVFEGVSFSKYGGIGAVYFIIYGLLLLLWFGLTCFYYADVLIKGKFSNNKGHAKDLVKKFGLGLLGVGLISAIMVCMNSCGSILYIFMWFYLVIEFICLLLCRKKVSKNNYLDLIVIFILEVLMLLLQGRSFAIPFINIGIVLATYYMYFKLENDLVYEVNALTLERDYAKKQCIDKSSFLKVLSHEIRTPINTIDGFSQVIEDNDNIDEIKSDLNDIRLASRELMDVINGMIDLSIIESGNLEIINENYNVYDMFDDIINIINSKMRDKDVELKVEIDDDIPEVLMGDSARLSQVVLNLLTNAIKYTDKGNITLKVGSVKSSSKCRLKISVSDTGKGIKNEDISKIFDLGLERENSSLGLAVSKFLIELMGGEIEVESTEGKGSIFTVTVDQTIVSQNKEEKISRKRNLKVFDASGKRILLVDDNKLNLKVASKLLQAYNVEVVTASGGQECLDLIDKDTNFDLILMDDLMPEMSGTECLDILKKIERVDGFYIPVVVLTANAVSGIKNKYINAGFEDYLSKPIDKYELDRILTKYLKGKK